MNVLPRPSLLTAFARRGVLLLFGLGFAHAMSGADDQRGSAASQRDSRAPFRLAFSSSMFTEINENDARASIKVWAQTVAQERGIAAEADARIIKGTAAIIHALQSGEIDAVGLPTDEFFTVSRVVAFSHLFAAVLGAKMTEEYVVLVHRDNPAEHLAQLHGQRLLALANPRTSLAEPWLDTLLLRSGQPAVQTFFGSVQHAVKIPRVVLPVFFRHSDACLVNRRGFDTMCELNPQVGRQLRVIARSEPVVATVFCIRAGFESPSHGRILASLRDLHTTPAGQQVLAIFQSERLQEPPPEFLDSSFALLTEHARIMTAAKTAPPRSGAPASATFGKP